MTITQSLIKRAVHSSPKRKKKKKTVLLTALDLVDLDLIYLNFLEVVIFIAI